MVFMQATVPASALYIGTGLDLSFKVVLRMFATAAELVLPLLTLSLCFATAWPLPLTSTAAAAAAGTGAVLEEPLTLCSCTFPLPLELPGALGAGPEPFEATPLSGVLARLLPQAAAAAAATADALAAELLPSLSLCSLVIACTTSGLGTPMNGSHL